MKVELSDVMQIILTEAIAHGKSPCTDDIIRRVKALEKQPMKAKCPLCDKPAETNIIVGDGELMAVCMEHAQKLNGKI